MKVKNKAVIRVVAVILLLFVLCYIYLFTGAKIKNAGSETR